MHSVVVDNNAMDTCMWLTYCLVTTGSWSELVVSSGELSLCGERYSFIM